METLYEVSLTTQTDWFNIHLKSKQHFASCFLEAETGVKRIYSFETLRNHVYRTLECFQFLVLIGFFYLFFFCCCIKWSWNIIWSSRKSPISTKTIFLRCLMFEHTQYTQSETLRFKQPEAQPIKSWWRCGVNVLLTNSISSFEPKKDRTLAVNNLMI